MQQYKIIDLGTLGGDSSTAYSINNYNEVVGWSSDYNGISHAFIWDVQQGMRDLQPLGDSHSGRAFGINNIGQVVGDVIPQGFVWDPATGMQSLGLLPSGTYSRAYDINDFGMVVGSGNTDMGFQTATLAFLWSGGGMMTLAHSYLPGAETQAKAININGLIVGSSTDSYNPTEATLWHGIGNMQRLGRIPNTTYSQARDINNQGQVVGVSGNYAFIWDSQLGMRNLDYGVAEAINNNSQIVGAATVGYVEHAMIWNPSGTRQDLGTLPNGWENHAFGINDYGTIIGWASDSNFHHHAVIWQPVPEPMGLLSLGGGLFFFLFLRKKH